jgi:glycosyltransferase involved in cell wall biosynthesis
MPVTPRPRIVVNCLVKNEERWIWYALQSVINYVDQILVWDTGSTDSTADIINSISEPKISFKQVGSVNKDKFTRVRQQMLRLSQEADWIMLLDGDEIWPDEAIKETRHIINTLGNKFEYLINGYYNPVGDIFHYQNPSVGKYHIGSYSGNINVRFVNNKIIPGLHFNLPYGKEGLFDGSNTPIQNRSPMRIHSCEQLYLHTSHLSRSSQDRRVMQRSKKFKYELGHRFLRNFSYPSCLYLPPPPQVKNPWIKRNLLYTAESAFLFPFIKIKRLFDE